MQNQHELLSLARRVEQLERKNRRQGRFIKAGAAGAILLLVLGAKAAPKLLEAQKFVLKDEKNRERIAVGTFPDGLACVIYDVAGKPSFRLGITEKGTMSFKSLVEPAPAAPKSGAPSPPPGHPPVGMPPR